MPILSVQCLKCHAFFQDKGMLPKAQGILKQHVSKQCLVADDGMTRTQSYMHDWPFAYLADDKEKRETSSAISEADTISFMMVAAKEEV